MTHFSHRHASALATLRDHASLRRRLSHTATALATGWMLAACGGGGGSENTPPSADTAAPAATSTPASAAQASTATSEAPAAIRWSTSFQTRYQVRTVSDLGLQPTALNSRGDIAGFVSQDGKRSAALWSGGEVRSTLALTDPEPCGVGSPCKVASADFLDDDRNLYIAWLYKGVILSREVWRAGAAAAEPLDGCLGLYGVSDAGDVLCQHSSPSANFSQLWNLQARTATLLSGEETAMNRAGTRAGVSSPGDWNEGTPVHQLFKIKGGNITVHNLHGYATAKVTRINAQETVIGQRTLPGDDGIDNTYDSSRTRPFLWQPGSEPVDLPCPETFGRALDINQDGTVVGECRLTEGDTIKFVAVLWKDGQLVDLGGHAGASGWTLYSAWAINDLGWILTVGHPKGSDADLENVVLVPQP